LETSDFDSNPGAGGIPYVGPFLPAHFQHPEGTTGRLFSSAHDTGGGFEGFGLISGFPGVLGATVTAIPGVNAGEPYYLQQEPIMLADSVEGSYSQAAWDLGTDGFFDSPVGLRPVVSTTMVESWGFTPAMTGRSPYK
jgi:hypothetical protein